MATGYTASVEDGTITDFEEFALLCARAFGATVSMRDEPLDRAIPDAFPPDNYYAQSAMRAGDELGRLEAMSPTECAAAQAAEIQAAEAYRSKYLADHEQQQARYDAMLAKVKAWEPPTDDHIEMKRFMVDQLEISMPMALSRYTLAQRLGEPRKSRRREPNSIARGSRTRKRRCALRREPLG